MTLRPPRHLLPSLCIVAASLWAPLALAKKQTVCTITVNSADEKQTFQRHLPPSKYEFVELVASNRSDWLATACQAKVSCDVLIVSGHYDGANVFFSDRLEAQEFLPVSELERVSCSDSCPGLFAKLKAVYLFGCNTLNPDALSSASAEVVRSLVRDGHSRAEADRVLRSLNASHGESSRDRMRLVFKDVPVIYGFSSVAPLGPVAGATLNRYFQGAGPNEVGDGRTSARLLAAFAPHGMTAAKGMTDTDPHAAMRQDVCQFADERLSDAHQLQFIHQLLQRDLSQARMFLDRIERTTAALDTAARQVPDVAEALAAIARDEATRTRFLAFARDADQPAVQARMLDLAEDLGWLTAQTRSDELTRMFADLLHRNAASAADVDLACGLNSDRSLDGTLDAVTAPTGRAEGVANAAVRACMGNAQGHARTLQGLLSPSLADLNIAQTYLRHRPMTDVVELRRVVAGVVGMPASDAKVRALESLGRLHLSDRETLVVLTKHFSHTPSWTVQAAIAGVLIRADHRAFASPDLVRTFTENRRASPSGDNMIDALIRKLQSP